tara:strand:+ start:908 stop:1558 length:651 start_codon:yes stop_codon:yes gene_type:complete
MKTHKKFDFSEVVEFDKHIAMSIPNYDGLIDIVTAFFLELMPPTGTCIDIGCSTGSLLNSLSLMTKGTYKGVDLVDFEGDKNFHFEQGDGVDFLAGQSGADIIISLFTLQFLGKNRRKDALREIGRLVDEGGYAVIAEKLYMGDALTNGVFHRRHMMSKRKVFLDGDILDKDEALFGSMYCSDSESAEIEYASIGKATRIWQSYNFAATIIRPKGE